MPAQDKITTYPTVSFIIPVLNEEKRIKACLQSVFKQSYPQEKIEVIVIDGGSKDKTVKLAKKFPITLLKNPDTIAEYGKAIGLRHTDSKYFVLLDADNVIEQADCLEKLLYPLEEDDSLLGSMSYFLDDKNDYIFNRYFTAIQATDPLARFLQPKFKIETKDNYQVLYFNPASPPPIGPNGFIWRRKVISGLNWEQKFEEGNMMAQVAKKGYHSFAKVPGYGIHHYYVDSFSRVISKKLKIARKFLGRKNQECHTWVDDHSNFKFYLGVLYLGTGIGPLAEGLYHFIKSGKWPWLLHPVVSMLTIAVYAWVKIKNMLGFKVSG